MIGVADGGAVADHLHLAVIDPDRPFAQALHLLCRVADEHPCRAARENLVHALLAFLLESCVAHSQDLVHDQDRCQAEAHGHEAGRYARDREDELRDVDFLISVALFMTERIAMLVLSVKKVNSVCPQIRYSG